MHILFFFSFLCFFIDIQLAADNEIGSTCFVCSRNLEKPLVCLGRNSQVQKICLSNRYEIPLVERRLITLEMAPSRKTTKKNSSLSEAPKSTENEVIQTLDEEFATRAALILNEAGGKMLSSTFKRRWKFTFPNVPIDRYKQGRKLSLRQLLLIHKARFRVEQSQPSIDGGGPRDPMLVLTQQTANSLYFCDTSAATGMWAPSRLAPNRPSWRAPSVDLVDGVWGASGVVSETEGEDEEGWEQDRLMGPMDLDEAFDDDCIAATGESCDLAIGDPAFAQGVRNGLDFLAQMKGMGITFANPFTYRSLLHAMAKAAGPSTQSYTDEALRVLDLMEDLRVSPTPPCFAEALTACARSPGGLWAGLEVIRRARRVGVALPAPQLCLLFDACVKEAHGGNSVAVEQALAVLEVMRQGNLAADAGRCLALIEAPYAGAWCTHYRIKVLDLMQVFGHDPSQIQSARELVTRLDVAPSDASAPPPDWTPAQAFPF